MTDGAFELAPLGDALRRDAEVSVRSWALYWGGDFWPVLGRLAEAVRTGKSGRELHGGGSEFEHLAAHPEQARLFNAAMVELTRLSTPGIVGAYDFSAFHRVVDVGGGSGELLAAILHAYPRLTGVLFDLPSAIARAQARVDNAGIASRCELVGGSFFESVPAGEDLYVLKGVIHDWDDEQSTTILGTCVAGMRPDSRLLVVERLRPVRLDSSPASQAVARSDLVMLVALAAQERSEAEVSWATPVRLARAPSFSPSGDFSSLK